jgi:hypothetical protein
MFWGESFKYLNSSSCNAPTLYFVYFGEVDGLVPGVLDYSCAPILQGPRCEEIVVSIPQREHFMFVWYIICAMYEQGG